MQLQTVCKRCGSEWTPNNWELSVIPHQMDISDTGEKHCKTNFCTHCDKLFISIGVLNLKQKVERGECPGPILWREVNAERQQAHQNTA